MGIPVALWAAVLIGANCLVVVPSLFRAPMTDADRASWAVHLSDRGAYSDLTLREMEGVSGVEMGALIDAEMARRGMLPGV